MRIHSLISVDGVPFGTPREGLPDLGTPVRDYINRLGDHVLDFGKIIYRFGAEGMVEVSFPLPTVIDLNGHEVEGSALLAYLEQHDASFRRAHGFGVAATLGIAVDLDDDEHWTTVFVAGRWDQSNDA